MMAAPDMPPASHRRPASHGAAKWRAPALPPHLFVIHPWRAGAAVLLDWLLIAASFAAAIRFPSWPVYLAAALLVARTQLALAVLMHESAHGTLFGKRWLNDLAGQFCAAGPLMVSMYFYRRGHLQHHRAPMSADDPVALVFRIADYPVTRRELVRRLLCDLCGWSCFGSVADVVAGKHRRVAEQAPGPASPRMQVIASIVLAQGLLLGGLALAGHAMLYATLWILPALTLLQLFARIRAITEHAGLPAAEDQSSNARTVVRRGWQTFLFGPHGIHYHIEHHCHPRVPFYHLPQAHRLLRASLPPANLYRGYGAVLRAVVRPGGGMRM